MKKSSVLNRRAALFAAIVVMTTVAVGLSAFALIEHGRITSAVRGQLLPQARVLADSAAGYAATDSARGRSCFLVVWLSCIHVPNIPAHKLTATVTAITVAVNSAARLISTLLFFMR